MSTQADGPISDMQTMLTLDLHGIQLLSVHATGCEVRRVDTQSGQPGTWAEVDARSGRLSMSDLSALTLSTPEDSYRPVHAGGIVIRVSDGLSWTAEFQSSKDVHLRDAWRLYGLYSFCNLGKAADTWMDWLDHLSGRPRRDLLAFLREWVVWTTHRMVSDEIVEGSDNELIVRALMDCSSRASCDGFRDWLKVGTEWWNIAPEKSPVYRFY